MTSGSNRRRHRQGFRAFFVSGARARPLHSTVRREGHGLPDPAIEGHAINWSSLCHHHKRALASSQLHSDLVATRLLLCFLLQLFLDLLNLRWHGALDVGWLLAPAHLPFHELVECTCWVCCESLIGALLCHLAFGVDANDAIRALNRGQTMRYAYCGVVLLE